MEKIALKGVSIIWPPFSVRDIFANERKCYDNSKCFLGIYLTNFKLTEHKEEKPYSQPDCYTLAFDSIFAKLVIELTNC